MKLNNQNMSTYNLVRKLLQLERLINFVLLYFVGAKIDNLLVALVGRFHHTHSPQQVYKSVFKSHFVSSVEIENSVRVENFSSTRRNSSLENFSSSFKLFNYSTIQLSSFKLFNYSTFLFYNLYIRVSNYSSIQLSKFLIHIVHF
jgi:hypothetical protein